MRTRQGLLAGLIVAGVLAGSSPAGAATVSVGASNPTDTGNMGDVSFTGAPGEANRLTMGLDTTGGVVVADAGAPLSAGAGCAPVDAHIARCAGSAATGAIALVGVDLGDGDDTATLALPGLALLTVEGRAGNDSIDASASTELTGLQAGNGTFIAGDAGDDRLVGSPGFDELDGGPGADTVDGAAGRDTVDGGSGADALRGGAGGDQMSGDATQLVDDDTGTPGSDVIDGGPGLNSVSYAEHDTPLTIDLASGTAVSSGGEQDRLSGFTWATGGHGRDVIRGTGGDDILQGSFDLVASEAPDVLVGRGGDDRLSAAGRGSRLMGGPGSDGLEDGDDAPIRLRCGPGRDTVDSLFARVLVPAACEVVHTSSYDISRLHVTRRRVRLHLSPESGGRPTLTLRSRHRKLYGRARVHAHAHRLVIHLTRAGRRAARAHRLAVARLGRGGESWVWRL